MATPRKGTRATEQDPEVQEETDVPQTPSGGGADTPTPPAGDVDPVPGDVDPGTDPVVDPVLDVDEASAPDATTQDPPAHPVTEDPTAPTAHIVIVDLVAWREPVPGTVPQRFKTLRRFIGHTLPDTVPASEIARLQRLGAIGSPAQARVEFAARERGLPTVPQGEVGDNELSGWAQPNLVAYVTQFPTEAERVNRIERNRQDGPRAVVVRAAGFDPETGDRLE
jgi:hypothetical protein